MRNTTITYTLAIAVLTSLVLKAEPAGPRSHKWPESSPAQSGKFEEWVAANAPTREPMIAVEGAAALPEEDAALEKALFKGGSANVAKRLAEFVGSYPQSRWRPICELNLGLYRYQKGYFTEAIERFQSAYALTKGGEGENTRRIADGAAAQLSQMYARLGRMEDLGPLLEEAFVRNPGGSAAQIMEHSREAFVLMNTNPGLSFRCGPLALARVREALGLKPAFHPVINGAKSTWRGFSLAEVGDFARQMEMNYVAVKAKMPFDDVPVPCVIHWKQNHYAAVVTRTEKGSYMVRDLTFGFDAEVSLDALNEEASGYFVADAGQIPAGWQKVGSDEAWKVFGRGVTGGTSPNATSPDDKKCPDCPPGANPPPGMVRYSVHAMMASLHLEDIPIGYTPPVGPGIYFLLHYNQRETVQPTTINYGNVGRQWGHNWTSWVELTSTTKANLVLPGGGAEEYTRTSGTSPFAVSHRSYSTLTVTGTNAYRRDLPDGSRQVFDAAQDLGGGVYRVFLTQFIDPYGNTVQLAYDGSFRLITITDAVNQVTALSYENSSYPYLVTKVGDPFGREALLAYNSSGQLTSITDVEGIVSSMTYGTGDFVNSLTTPYGTTTFAVAVQGAQRFVTATDPQGGTEKVEMNLSLSGAIPYQYPSDQTIPSTVSVGGNNVSFGTFDAYVYARNSFYWDKKQYALDPNNRNNAMWYHWLHAQDSSKTSPYLESIKPPLESWTFFNYPGAGAGFESTPFVSTPSKTARVVNVISGTKQVALSQTEVNAIGKPTKLVDPLGRETVLVYAGNLIDLIEVKQKNAGGTYDTLFTGTYNSQHLPTAITGADGQVTSFGWNSVGQLTSGTNAKNEATGYTYTAGYLTSIDPAFSGTSDQIALAYDTYGRVRTRTQWGYTLTYDYDNLDRITKVTYPDSTTEEVIYEAMHARWIKDRNNFWTRQDVNAIQQMVGVLNPAAEYTSYEWCTCGSLEAIIDAQGRATRWMRDLQGRQTDKIYADGRVDSYDYNPYSGWLETVIEPAGQQVKNEYALDGRPTATRYVNETISTPDVTLTWDPKYPRVTAMVDGTGTTSYTYRTPGQSGAGSVYTIDGPLGSDTITLAYDDLGRIASRTLDATAESVTYDALGRIVTISNPLDTFTVAYSGTTGLPLTVTGSKGLSVTNTYYSATGNYLTESTAYAWSGTQGLAQFGYQYDAGGRITRWDHQVGGGDPRRIVPGYDAVSRLINAVTMNPSTSAQVAAEANRYDRVGNRLGSQSGTEVTSGTFNTVNQLQSLVAGGEATLQGSLNEPGTITVGSRSTRTDAQNTFRLSVPVTTGSNQLIVVSQDVNGNSLTNTATFTVATSGTRSFSYDLNGNTTNDGQNTYSWDGANRLVKITYSGTNNYTEFTYDGLGRRVSIKEVESGTTASDKRFVWDGVSIAEMRSSNGTNVEKRYYRTGFQVSGTSTTDEYFYVRDHLGSIRAVIDESGVERGRWSYGLWGSRGGNQITTSPIDADFGYTGHYSHARSGLVAAPFRFYDSATIRWLSRDPIGEAGGINLYGYVANNPINYVDPWGLTAELFTHAAAGGIVYQAVGIGASMFGHTSMNINGTTYSYGQKGWAVLPTDVYLDKNKFRDTWGQELNLTPEQEAELLRLLEQDVKDNPPYDTPTRTCSERMKDLMEEATGEMMGTKNTTTPWHLHNDLKNLGKVKKENFYPKNTDQ